MRAVEAMQRGTTSEELLGSLSWSSLSTLTEIMQRAEKYIQQDDALVTSIFAREDKEGERSRRGKIGRKKSEIEKAIEG